MLAKDGSAQAAARRRRRCRRCRPTRSSSCRCATPCCFPAWCCRSRSAGRNRSRPRSRRCATSARSASCCSATPRRRSDRDRHASHGHARQYRALHHRAGRHAPSRLPGRAALPDRRISQRLAVLGRARAAHSRAGNPQRRDRGAVRQSQGAGRRGHPIAAAGAGRSARRDPVDRSAVGARRSGDRLHGREAGREAGDSRNRRHCGAHGQGLAHARATASRCCGCRRKSAGRPRRRSTSASARCCCASRWRRSSASSAKARRARPPKWPSSTRPSATPACRRRSRTRRARNCAGCSACPKRPANTAWCAPISIG